MRTFVLSSFIVALALLMSSPAVHAQSNDEDVVAQAVEAFRKAALAKDRDQFQTLLSDQLSYGHSAGRTETKRQFIDDATGNRSVWKSIYLTNQSISIVGDNAIVRHTFTGDNESDGKINNINIGVLQVWTKQDGHWKLLARQAYRI
jgi:ketosteroid isomerase-like protein